MAVFTITFLLTTVIALEQHRNSLSEPQKIGVLIDAGSEGGVGSAVSSTRFIKVYM